MSGAQHTPGPWEWFTHSGDRPYLATPDRGRLYVMDFGRKGMNGATPRFSIWEGLQLGSERGRRGGIMVDGAFLPDGALHPDACLIAAAPDLFSALDEARNAIRWYRERHPEDDSPADDEAMARIDAAIAKAAGGDA